ncbi:MAG: DUF3501 family protein [Proteobacteria bacterium]|nr:DUF3501 family protein [Pseudomonadota bacterium]
MPAKREITRDDILPMDAFAAVRNERRAEIAALRKNRRFEIGPSATIYFECFETMWWQVHEMLFVEKGGDAQLADELEAYNPLVPKGDELVATLMFEIDDAGRRDRLLARLGGVENTVTIGFAGETVAGVPEGDVARSTEDGRASSVHFLHFRFTPAQIASFREPGARVDVGIGHEAYGHMAVMPEPVRQALSEDFD